MDETAVAPQWNSTPLSSFLSGDEISNAIDATYSVLNNNLLVIGGRGKNGNKASLYLKVNVFSLDKATFLQPLPFFIETNMAINRFGHCSVSLPADSRVYIFGGASVQTEHMLAHAVSLEMSPFGVRATITSSSDRIACTGLIAEVYGIKKDQICLFGGRVDRSTCSSNLTRFAPGVDVLPEDRFKTIEINGASPVGRCNHSASICGSNNQFLVICAGQIADGNILEDIWLIDLSNVDPSCKGLEQPEDPKAKKAPPAKGKTVEPEINPNACSWIKISLDTAFEASFRRCLHGLRPLSHDGGGSFSFAIFNGMNDYGTQLLDVYKLSLSPIAASTGGNEMKIEFCELVDSKEASGKTISVIITNDDNGYPAVILTFCGDFLFYIAFDPNHHVAQSLVSFPQASIFSPQESAADSSLEDDQIPSSMTYENGDTYTGSMQRILWPGQTLFIGDEVFIMALYQNGTVAEITSNGMYDILTSIGELISQIDPSNLSLKAQPTVPMNKSANIGECYSSDQRIFVRHGQGIMRYASGEMYEGQWKADARNGDGELHFVNNIGTYAGEFVDDQMTGQGVVKVAPCAQANIPIVFDNASAGFTYSGRVESGVLEGFGRVESSDMSFEGNFVGGTFHGKGVLHNREFTYEGNFERGVRSDPNAEYTYADGSRYIGPVHANKRNGIGSFISPDGRLIYSGKYVGDKKNGKGKWTSPFGEKYVGIFEDDKPSGQGEMTYPNGSTYTGFWKQGKREGKGKLVYCDGIRKEGLWKEDKIVEEYIS